MTMKIDDLPTIIALNDELYMLKHRKKEIIEREAEIHKQMRSMGVDPGVDDFGPIAVTAGETVKLGPTPLTNKETT